VANVKRVLRKPIETGLPFALNRQDHRISEIYRLEEVS